jgi:hypothetical protein
VTKKGKDQDNLDILKKKNIIGDEGEDEKENEQEKICDLC